MNDMDAYRIAVEEIARNEKQLLIRFIAELSERPRGAPRGDAMLIARALMKITALYESQIKKTYGGWTCGTHKSSYRSVLSRAIAAKYSEEACNRLIAFCCAAGTEPGDEEIGQMLEQLLAWRPKPSVHRYGGFYGD